MSESNNSPVGSTNSSAAESADAAARSEITDSGVDQGAMPKHSWLSRLYTGTGAFEVVGKRRFYYGLTGALVAIALLSIILRGFTFGIDFEGGSRIQFPAEGGVETSAVETVYSDTLGFEPVSEGANRSLEFDFGNLRLGATRCLNFSFVDIVLLSGVFVSGDGRRVRELSHQMRAPRLLVMFQFVRMLEQLQLPARSSRRRPAG